VGAGGELTGLGLEDPAGGGKVRLGRLGTYYGKELAWGDFFRLDGFVSRSLFDLYSNFTFFLNDPVRGDEIQQHDSRLQQGLNAQFLHPYKLFGRNALLTVGSNFHDNEINVGLFHTQDRVPIATTTSALAHVTNTAGYLQQGLDLLEQRLHLDAGTRYDYFRFDVNNLINSSLGGLRGVSRFQPKANLSYTPTLRLPLTIFASYGR